MTDPIEKPDPIRRHGQDPKRAKSYIDRMATIG
jgi:hypothetical protein